MTVQVNDAANFSVTYCSNPEPNWEWGFTSPNGSVGKMDGVDFNPSGNSAAITIADVQEQHFGNYTITAWNDHGTEPAVFMLQAPGKTWKWFAIKQYKKLKDKVLLERGICNVHDNIDFILAIDITMPNVCTFQHHCGNTSG